MRQKRLLLLLVLLLTATTGAWAQTGVINGLFSVSATKRVYFSKGNLQYDGTNWKFAENQWEVLGANGTGATGTVTNYPMDLFTWGNIDSPTYNGTTYYTENADLSGITDWGSRMGSGWYTLSKEEWLYLFGMESSNTDKSGHARYRKYFRAKVNGLPGIVLLPDDLSGISDIPAESSRGTASNFAKTYTTDAWSAMESAGCVFLPTAGFRKTDASVSHVGWSGFYWESTAYDAGKAYTVGFDNTFVDPAGNFDRTFGFAVRLVIDQHYLTLKDGVKDADKWTVKVGEGEAQALPIGGLKGDGSETVTLQYNGRLKVKGVKATSDAAPAAKPDLLPAVFTVDAGKTVKFSKGNLQATYNGSSWIWGFAEHQWDYIGNAAGNTSINGNGTVSANGTVDLFGWVGASSTWTGAAQYGISNSTATNNVDGYGNVGGEAQKVGWGATVGAGWRTLTRPEWLYLLSTRETGITVNTTNHARYTLAIINTDGTAVKGLIIFPDSYAGGSPAGVSWGTINAVSTFGTTCTSAGWTALEAAGCVFLPAAGYREASTVKEAGVGAGYWSSSSSNAPYAFGLYFESDYMTIQYGGSRKYGFSVRLVHDAD